MLRRYRQGPQYVQTGNLGGIALTEVSAETIHEAVKVIKILAVGAKLSLFSTDILHNGVAAACAQHGIPLLAYSPIGRGGLTGAFKKFEDLSEDMLELQMGFPRFQKENFDKNLELVEAVEKLAEKKGCMPAQLAISWTMSLSRRHGMPTIIPIPGSTTVDRIEENCKVVDVTDEEMLEIDGILAKFTVAGGRYPDHISVNT